MVETQRPAVGVMRRVVEHSDGGITIEGTGSRRYRAWTVAVNSEGFSADRIDMYVVIAGDENEAIELAEREHRGEWPSYSISESEAYTLGLDTARVQGRLVNEDGS